MLYPCKNYLPCKRHLQQSMSRQDNSCPQPPCRVLGQLSFPCKKSLTGK